MKHFEVSSRLELFNQTVGISGGWRAATPKSQSGNRWETVGYIGLVSQERIMKKRLVLKHIPTNNLVKWILELKVWWCIKDFINGTQHFEQSINQIKKQGNILWICCYKKKSNNLFSNQQDITLLCQAFLLCAHCYRLNSNFSSVWRGLVFKCFHYKIK